MKNNRYLLPLAFAGVLIFGILIGVRIAPTTSAKPMISSRSVDTSRISDILKFISYRYVDSINVDSIMDKFVYDYLNDPETIDEIFKKLDPHSSYIHKEDLQSFNDDLDGDFDGIGIEFNIVDDTILVVAALSGGPSEKLGIMSGDKIIKINDSTVAGNGITNEKVVKQLRGKKGTKVKVEIKRGSSKNLMAFDITRDQIPVSSIDVSYMIDENTGYIKINSFAEHTPVEFADALQTLINKGMKDLVIDLRGNPGGYLMGAVDIADEFLAGTPLIVYTNGRAVGRQDYRAGKNGLFEQGNVVILVNEFSASASEIFAGAMQDNKRATIVGRRSFGKGLVQEVYPLPDSSAVRLTIARYYTPSGKSIQRPYNEGVDEYYSEYLSILQNGGELPDSMKGKYSDWGINPDIHISVDTTPVNKTFNMLFNSGLIQQFTYSTFSENPHGLESYKSSDDFVADYKVSDDMFNKFMKYVNAHDSDHVISNAQMEAARFKIETGIKAYLARQKWGNEGYFKIMNQIDIIVQAGVGKLNGSESK